MIEPKSVTINNQDFIVSKVPAFEALMLFSDLAQLLNGELLLDDKAIKFKEKRILDALTYCGVPVNNDIIYFKTKALVDNHLPDFSVLTLLIQEFTEYNMGFLKKEKSLASQSTI